MSLIELKSCCFCIPLRTGTLILGYLNLIFSVIAMALSIFFIFNGGVIMRSAVDIKHHSIHLDENERIIAVAQGEALQIAGVTLLALGIIVFISSLVKLIFVIFLLIGGHNGKPGHIKAYLVYSVVMLVITLILTTGSFIAAPTIEVIPRFFACALEIYFLLVIRSYLIKLRDTPEGDRTGKV